MPTADDRTRGVRGSRATLLRRGRRSVWAGCSLALVLAGVLAATLAAHEVEKKNRDRARLAFHLSADEVAAALKLSIQHEEDLVISTSAFIASSPHASAAAFDRWSQSVRAMQRFPELQNVGLIGLVAAPRLAAFERRIESHPVEPLGVGTADESSPFQVFPPGRRPFYCFAVAGLARSLHSYLPSGLDYCALAPSLIRSRDSGESSYAPFAAGRVAELGVETPVYRNGVTPATVSARRREFLGWLGELIVPEVVLGRALQSHPDMAVLFRYDSGVSHVRFSDGRPPRGAQVSTIPLHNGWTVVSYAAPPRSGLLVDREAATTLIGGTLLSLLAGVLMFVLGTGRMRALALVREKTRELSHQALHDALTGLPNRALVLDRAEQMISRAARHPGALSAALFVDIDAFKHVNDKLGHAAGDHLLRVVGERLQDAVRSQDTVGRLGGDEFVILVESLPWEGGLDDLADRLTEALREPVLLEDGREMFSVTASVGVALGHYATPDELLRDADLALYAAKAAGKDRYVLFDPKMQEGAGETAALELELSRAIAERQLCLVYQPIYELPGRRVAGVEALLRWRHPERGVIAPGDFIPLAEESGLIVPIGRWVLEQAARQGAAWAKEGRPLGVSVNVSAHQLSRRSFAEEVRGALRDSGLEPTLLTLEITETTLVRDLAGASERLREIRALGVRVAIDDFGTGYTSLSHLQRMPVDVLKVDRSFIAALGDGRASRGLLEAILGVGRALSLRIVAEGIEDEGQLAIVVQMGCQMAQGFLLGRPVPAEELNSCPGLGAARAAAAGDGLTPV